MVVLVYSMSVAVFSAMQRRCALDKLLKREWRNTGAFRATNPPQMISRQLSKVAMPWRWTGDRNLGMAAFVHDLCVGVLTGVLLRRSLDEIFSCESCIATARRTTKATQVIVGRLHEVTMSRHVTRDCHLSKGSRVFDIGV